MSKAEQETAVCAIAVVLAAGAGGMAATVAGGVIIALGVTATCVAFTFGPAICLGAVGFLVIGDLVSRFSSNVDESEDEEKVAEKSNEREERTEEKSYEML